MDLIYNDTEPAQDYISFTERKDGTFQIAEEDIGKIRVLFDKVVWFERRNKELVSRIKDLEQEANYWWRLSESGSL